MGTENSKECEQDEKKMKWGFRMTRPYIGYAGMVASVIEFVWIIVLLCMITGFFSNDAILLAIMLVLFVIGVVGLMVNAFWMNPKYNKAKTDSSSSSSEPIIDPPGKPSLYAKALKYDLNAGNDEKHFRHLVMSSLFLIIFYGIFLAKHGIHAFQPIPAVFTNYDIMHYFISKIYQVLTLLVCAKSFYELNDSHSDFAWRHMVAINKKNADNNGPNMPLGRRGGNTLL